MHWCTIRSTISARSILLSLELEMVHIHGCRCKPACTSSQRQEDIRYLNKVPLHSTGKKTISKDELHFRHWSVGEVQGPGIQSQMELVRVHKSTSTTRTEAYTELFRDSGQWEWAELELQTTSAVKGGSCSNYIKIEAKSWTKFRAEIVFGGGGPLGDQLQSTYYRPYLTKHRNSLG